MTLFKLKDRNNTKFYVDMNGNVGQSGCPNELQCVAEVALTAAQLTTLHSVGCVLLPAPSNANAYIVVTGLAFEFDYGSVQFTGGGAISAFYTGQSTNVLAATIPAATLTAAASSITYVDAAGAAQTVTPGVGITLQAATADFAAGNSGAVVKIWFSLVTPGVSPTILG